MIISLICDFSACYRCGINLVCFQINSFTSNGLLYSQGQIKISSISCMVHGILHDPELRHSQKCLQTLRKNHNNNTRVRTTTTVCHAR